MTFPVLVLVSGVSALVGYVCAEERGRNERTWAVLGLLLGVLAVLALFLLPKLPRESDVPDDRLPLFGNGN